MSDITQQCSELEARLLDIELPVTILAKRILTSMVAQNLARGQGEFLLITGPAGTGKSHLRHQLTRLALSLLSAFGAKRPVVSIHLSGATNLKDFSHQLALAGGNPVTLHKMLDKSARDMSAEVGIDLARDQTRFIFLDEGHNMLLERPDKQSEYLEKWIKGLTYQGISVVFLGLPQLEETFTRYKELKSRLFRERPIQTGPLSFGSKAEVDIALAFLGDLQAAYNVPTAVEFRNPSLATPLLAATLGNQRAILRVVQAANTARLERNGALLELRDFRDAAELAGLDWRDEK